MKNSVPGYITAGIAALAIGIVLRFLPYTYASQNLTSLRAKATNITYRKIKDDIEKRAKETYPNMPESDVKKIVTRTFDNAIASNADEIKLYVEKSIKKMRSAVYDNVKNKYLMAS
ncbi:MAG: hypothetical protein JW994_00190, partial [Candidatus Omnitrophica bacterium]|nr:hypothetical protein [Candidatus Omnitrophota bacterium]